MLLTLDLASRSGYAAGDPADHPCLTPLESAGGRNPPPEFGAHEIAPIGTNIGPFLWKADKWFRHLWKTYKPTEVAAELVYSTGKKSNQAAAAKLFGLYGHCCWFFYDKAGIKVQTHGTNKIRSHFVGKGSGKRAELKALVINGCHQRGWTGVGDDEDKADALAIFSYQVALTRGKCP